MWRHCSLLLILCLTIMAGSCSRETKKSQALESGMLKPEAAHNAGKPVVAESSLELEFTAPAEWVKETPSSSSRKMQYKLPRAEGDSEDAELVVYFFQGGGGTPQANIDRWIGQFTAPDGKPNAKTSKVTNKTINGIPVTIVDAGGMYSSSMGPMQGAGPKPNYRMLGAIAETGSGPWFIKLTGPVKTVSHWAYGFESFLDSMRQSR
jgi:hypothetical protein